MAEISTAKKEHTTHLSAGEIVGKTSARIEFRGRIDGLCAAVVELQIRGEKNGLTELVEELEEVRTKLYDLLLCEVTNRPCEELTLWGMGAAELRERSHHPAKYFGIGHLRAHHTMGETAAGLNALRTRVREAELSACRAFEKENGDTERADIVGFLNRLSSAIYVLTYKYLPEGYEWTIRF